MGVEQCTCTCQLLILIIIIIIIIIVIISLYWKSSRHCYNDTVNSPNTIAAIIVLILGTLFLEISVLC